jgi:hypothetical protein
MSEEQNIINTDSQGIQGLQGLQGTQGTQGTQGVQGVQGTQGTQGVQGVQTPKQSSDPVQLNKQKLYEPPTGHPPQDLPDYCRFPDGKVITNLRSLSDPELNALGWSGPYYYPEPKMVIKETDKMTDSDRNNLNSLKSLSYNAETKEWVSVNYDYDPETQEVIWSSPQKKYIFVPFDTGNTVRHQIMFDAGLTPSFQPLVVFVLWDDFRNSLISSKEFNDFVSSLMTKLPLLANSLPSVILNLGPNTYSSFEDLWKTIKDSNLLPSQEIIDNLVKTATECNLPQDFIQKLKGE